MLSNRAFSRFSPVVAGNRSVLSCSGVRGIVHQTINSSGLVERVSELVPIKQKELKEIRDKYSDVVLGTSTVDKTIGGMRGISCMLWDTSLLDPEKGIEYRGYSIPELQAKMPTYIEGGEPTPEGCLWLLLTGEIPTKAQTKALTQELHERSTIPAHVERAIRAYSKDLHPMTQFSAAILMLQQESLFAHAYEHENLPKSQYWKPTLEDSLNLIARIPRIAALIYRCTFHDGRIYRSNPKLDYSANFCRMLGFDNLTPKAQGTFDELMRLYLVIHADHEGGNVSAHATHLVGSTLSDAYLSFSAGLNGLAGPLHGLANQEVLRWTLDFQESIRQSKKEVTHESVREQAWATLNNGHVIPGFGHAVLRKTDPRYMSQREFALKHLADDELVKLVSIIYEVVPDVLLEHGKAKNPWPNVDAHSGCLLRFYGLHEFRYYTVLFGVSRALGVLSQLVWDRALGLPLERPKSLTLAELRRIGAESKAKSDSAK
eukprot:gb/GEZN01005039.1/.p1 GENE.gb/GEZN01005039.1/~~gb/GEZN01005039.1/.p1  ORF type:complete len:488 (-),score=56.54 gb/GEZN01005039.1/:354-1817(-)